MVQICFILFLCDFKILNNATIFLLYNNIKFVKSNKYQESFIFLIVYIL